MCFTLANLTPSFSMGNNLIHFFLNTNRTFIVFIHDPKFFVYTYNPQAIPMTTWILPKTKTFVSLSLVETTHFHLNLANNPCEEDDSYNFQVLPIILVREGVHLKTCFLWSPSLIKSETYILASVCQRLKSSGMHQAEPVREDRVPPFVGRLERQGHSNMLESKTIHVNLIDENHLISFHRCRLCTIHSLLAGNMNRHTLVWNAWRQARL